jgi:protein-S-isoprenylcysteine O-methyltransferase Ste14
MRKSAAIAGSSLFFALAPGVVAGLVPWLITRWQVHTELWLPLRALGLLLIIAAAAVLVHAFARFALDGRGTPAPAAPTETLVVTGLYRHLRNPMYVAVTAAIAGQALVLGHLGLLWYGLAGTAAMVTFVYGYEQPALTRRFGADYTTYRAAVPGWWPRPRPWRGEAR